MHYGITNLKYPLIQKTFISSYSYIYILYICTHINDFKLKEKQYG